MKGFPESRGRRIVRERSGGLCEIDRAPASEWSHRVDRSDGGTWAPSNGLDTCRRCHAWLHAEPEWAKEGGWRLPSTVDPEAEPAFLWTPFGQDWFRLTDMGDYVFSRREPVLPPWVEGALR